MTTLPVASLWARLVALFIDILIVVVLAVTFEAALFGEKVETYQQVLVLLIVMSIYQMFFLITTSSTLGKMAMRISVVDTQGLALRPDTAILRFLIYFIAGPILTVGYLVSLYLAVKDPLHRGLHDRVAGTLVIRGRPRQVDTLNRYL